jgi:hypothetical protein
MTLVDFEEFKRTILNPLFEEPAMKTYCFTAKNDEECLLSFSIDSESLMDAVYSSQFVKELENLDFFDDRYNFANLYSYEWSCFSLQEGVKGVVIEETFDIRFEAARTWAVN